MAVRETYKSKLNGLDKIEKFHYFKDTFNKLNFDPLRNCDENLDKKEFKDLILSMCNPELGITTVLVFKSFLLECAKENIGDSKLLIRKVNTYFEKFGW